ATPRTSQISLSSMWLLPLRHHCPATTPRAVTASVAPSGAGAAQYSAAYRSAATCIGVHPAAPSRLSSSITATSRTVVQHANLAHAGDVAARELEVDPRAVARPGV